MNCMDDNNLYQIALSDADDNTILQYFLKAKLPERLADDFYTLFDVVKTPLAIRSSSLLEDSHYQPFAGIYNTYMIPHLDDKQEMLHMVVAPPTEIGASLPKNLIRIGAQSRVIISRAMLASNATVPNSAPLYCVMKILDKE